MTKLLILFISHLFIIEGISQKNIQLYNYDYTFGVPFILICDTFKRISNENGYLQLNKTDLKKIENKVVKIEFANVLDGLIYTNKLYLKKGMDRKDIHVSFENIIISQFCRQENNLLYLRPKESALDDSN